MVESDQVLVARATRQSRQRWASAFLVAGALIAIIGALVYSSQKQTTLADAEADTTLAFNCLSDQASCDQEKSAARKAREARPFLIGGLAGGGVLVLIGLVLFASAPGVPREFVGSS